MQLVLPIYKPLGLTPLQAINAVKEKWPEYKAEKISYAGRLDPMAEGLLLLLVGEENKKRKEYEDLAKTYEFTVLLGIETDTYDILGKILSAHASNNITIEQFNNHLQKQTLEKIFESLPGKRPQMYPPFSSKTVQGKPLYWWARQNRLNEIIIPKKDIEIYSLDLLSNERIKKQKLRVKVNARITKIKGDFRQEEILQDWDTFLKTAEQSDFPTLHCRVVCSSGTYVRSICHEIGQKLGTGAIALEIKRTKIGDYSLSNAIILE